MTSANQPRPLPPPLPFERTLALVQILQNLCLRWPALAWAGLGEPRLAWLAWASLAWPGLAWASLVAERPPQRYACACLVIFMGRLLEFSRRLHADLAQNISLPKLLKRYGCARFGDFHWEARGGKVAQTLRLCVFW